MNRYRIIVRVTQILEERYFVDAYSNEEARECYHNGEGEFHDEDVVNTLDREIESIECIREHEDYIDEGL